MEQWLFAQGRLACCINKTLINILPITYLICLFKSLDAFACCPRTDQRAGVWGLDLDLRPAWPTWGIAEMCLTS